MTDAEISRRLALAIGWHANDVLVCFIFPDDTEYCHVWHNKDWTRFDSRDPAVIWPIAERYNCFPMASPGGWCAYFDCSDTMATAKTAAKAVALAVIKAHEGAKE